MSGQTSLNFINQKIAIEWGKRQPKGTIGALKWELLKSGIIKVKGKI